MTENRSAKAPSGRAESDAQMIARHFHEMAERLEAAGNYLEVLRAHLHEQRDAAGSKLADRAARPAHLAFQEFHRLRRLIEP